MLYFFMLFESGKADQFNLELISFSTDQFNLTPCFTFDIVNSCESTLHPP